MRAIQTLPEGSQLRIEVDLSKDMRTAIWLQLAGVLLFVAFGWMFLQIAAWLRPAALRSTLGSAFEIAGLGELLLFLLWLVVASVVPITLHELVHGLFFRILTGQPPKYGLGLGFAYAAAPDWYIAGRPYLLVASGPFLVLTLAGVLILSVVPAPAILWLLFAMTVNASGAVGDLWVVWRIWRLLQQPGPVWVRDNGAAIAAYRSEV
jgi:hypothetical protein